MIRSILLSLLVMMVLSCQRNSLSSGPHSLLTDSSALNFSFTSGTMDSFSVISNADWVISLLGSSASRLKLDKSSGTGNSRIHVTVIKANTSDSPQTSELKISVVNDPNQMPISLPVIQGTAYNGDSSRNAYGGSAPDYFYGATPSPDGGVVAVGFSESANGDLNGISGTGTLWITRLDSKGRLIWQKRAGPSAVDAGLFVIAGQSGGYLISGVSQAFGCIVKIDENGNIEWQKYFGGSGYSIFSGAVATPDGGYLLAGETKSADGDLTTNYGGIDAWVMKIDANGNKIWSRSYGGSGTDIFYSAAISSDNNYLLCGETSSNDHDVSGLHGVSDYWVIKLDTAGNIIWQHTFGGSGTESLAYIVKSNAGGYIITGQSNSSDGDAIGNHGATDCLLLKIDETGNKIWSKMIGGSANDLGTYIAPTSDGHFLITGSTNSTDGDINTGNRGIGDGWVFEIDDNANLIWQKTIGGSGDDVFWGGYETSPGNFEVYGNTNSIDGNVRGAHGDDDGWLFRFSR